MWSKYDPNATYFINITDLDPLLANLAESNHGSQLFLFKDQVAASKEFRESLMAQLDIPTFGNLKKVMFYDVL